LDSKRKLIRDLDHQVESKDEKYKVIKKKLEEKDRYLSHLISVKDELQRENEKVKKLAKEVSDDSDDLVAKLLEKDNQIKILKEERDRALELKSEIESTLNDQRDASPKKEGPEFILSEKCDSSVACVDDHEENAVNDKTEPTVEELPELLFEPLSDDGLDDEDDLKVTSTECSEKVKVETKPKSLGKNSVLRKSCPFKLELVKCVKDGLKILKQELMNKEISCLNVSDGSTDTILVALDDFARSFYPKLSPKRVGIILEELEIPFYHLGSELEDKVIQEGLKYSYSPIPLILFQDIERQEEDLKSLCSNF